MVRNKLSWKLVFYLISLNVFTKSLPIDQKEIDSTLRNTNVPEIKNLVSSPVSEAVQEEITVSTIESDKANETVARNKTRNSLNRQIRPGQSVRRYAIQLTLNGDSFDGRAVIDVELEQNTNEDPIVFHAEGLTVTSVEAGVFTEANAQPADFSQDDGLLEVEPTQVALSYILIIQYTAQLEGGGRGLYMGEGFDTSYIGMNLHPTHARRVFPCMDEPTEASTIRFTFDNMGYTNLIGNSLLEDNSETQFRALQGPPHLWGVVAHNMIPLSIPTSNVVLQARAGLAGQTSQADIAINSYFNNMNDWTQKDYFEIVLNQNNNFNILALPDVDREWHTLSTTGIWEPYLLMEQTHSITQRKAALVKIGEAIARQWFGYVIFPENWRYEWVVSGLASYSAWEMFKILQTGTVDNDITLLDVDSLFVADIIQESLLRDGYACSQPLESENDLFEEEDIRSHIYSNMKVKAPAILWMLRKVLGGEDMDFIQSAARALLAGRALQTVNTLNFIDALNSDWIFNGNDAVDDIYEFLEPWITLTGYPLIHVGLRQGGVLITQERFSITQQNHVHFIVPLTYTTSRNPNFEEPNTYPMLMMDATTTLNMALDEDEGEFVLFNIQGQGYYRVNYDGELWERIIDALNDPDSREEIHPLNRATLVDDALNLARSGRLDYDIAFQVVLSMEHETEYAVWKAFERNMNFLRKTLEAMVAEDDDLDPDIYLRMVRRTVIAVENELGFYPDPLINEPVMETLTRGLVMNHACRAGYRPCIAAAVDWFYDPNSNDPAVNPNIPHELRPAVYCAMVKEDDNDAIDALYARLEVVPTVYERVVILESFACSQDDDFIRTYLEETIAGNSPYTTEEKTRIFKAVAESSFENAFQALLFMTRRVNEIRDSYGGDEKLEELVFVLSENMVNFLANDFSIFVFAQNNNLDDSQMIAERALDHVNENMMWETRYLEYVYEWIDENDAPTLMVSLVLVFISFAVALFNH
ncbi:hypothetical protein K1T71_005411 [Dendrolimus kikuchii]|uniref:Uncharacterized protein n=1 Tax=Dendrolimus kikuchii TaxID=765133 RepID=A0ACC1D3U6_9NEOP|nr:hypothetical protein K1T71_005411 [Dendrolimus kikuchii]